MVYPFVLRVLYYRLLHLSMTLEVVAFANTPCYTRNCVDHGRKGVDQP